MCSLMESHPHAITSDFFIIIAHNTGGGVGLAGRLCIGVVSGCKHPGGGSHGQCFLYTLSAFTLGPEEGSANRLPEPDLGEALPNLMTVRYWGLVH